MDQKQAAFCEKFKETIEKEAQVRPFLAGAGTGAAASFAAPWAYDKLSGMFEQGGPSREALIKRIHQLRKMRRRNMDPSHFRGR